MSGAGPALPGGSDDRASRPFDAGLQPERTALAWCRTALALLVAAVVSIRVLPALVGAWAVVPAAAGAVLALVVFVASHRRYREQHSRLTAAVSDRVALPDGALPALVAGAIIAGGLAFAIVVGTLALR